MHTYGGGGEMSRWGGLRCPIGVKLVVFDGSLLLMRFLHCLDPGV